MLAPAQTGVGATHLDSKGIAFYGYSPTAAGRLKWKLEILNRGICWTMEL